MTAVAMMVSALLAAVAAAGILAPFLTGRAGRREPSLDPLEEERDELLRALRDLDEDRSTGRVDDPTYRTLRTDTETRAVEVLRALEVRDGNGDLAAGLRELRPPSPSGGRPRALPWAMAAALLVAALVPALAGAMADRGPGETITGGTPAPAPLAALEQRVQDHPLDPAGRLDLAEAYLARGDVEGAIEQYVAVLDIDPRNPEAHARLGALLFRAGRSREALHQVDRALELDPSYPEAMYYRGVILLQGLDRPGAAEAALRAYLEAAPFGAYRDQARGLLQGM